MTSPLGPPLGFGSVRLSARRLDVNRGISRLAVVGALVLLGAMPTPALAADGDVPDLALVNSDRSEWHLRYANGTVDDFFYGNPGDVPFMGDWNCDGVDTPGLYRPSDAFAYLRNSNTQGVADIRFFFGNPADVPLAGDFDGDGCDTLSIFRPSEQRFYIINRLGENGGGLGAAEFSFTFGNPGDKPVVGDWDGDGADEIGLHRESTGLFYWKESLATGSADATVLFGDPGDHFVAGDWDGDGDDNIGVFRQSGTERLRRLGGTFFMALENREGVADLVIPFGERSWLPVTGNLGISPCDPAFRGVCISPPPPGGYDGFAGLPDPANSTRTSGRKAIEGPPGVHVSFTTTTIPGEVISSFAAALTGAGWTVEGSGSDPQGVQGGGLQASNAGRYLNLQVFSDIDERPANAPGPPTTFLRYCVWPERPGNDGCEPGATAATSADEALLGGVPVLSDWAPDERPSTIPAVAGLEISYTTSDAPIDVVNGYSATVASLGWTVLDSGSDPTGQFGGGFQATNDADGRYLNLHAGGPATGTTFMDLCTWPTRPPDDHCGDH
jgi:hypothetical protein